MLSHPSPLSLLVPFLAGIGALFLANPGWSQGFTINTVAGGGNDYDCDGESPADALLSGPADVAIDASGNIYIANTGDDDICKISGGVVTLVAGGGGQGYAGDGGPAVNASLNQPFGVAVDNKGNVYIADTYNHAVRKVNSAGIISTFAGNGTGGNTGDGGPATSAELNDPWSVAVDASGNVFIADEVSHVIRKVTPDGTISTFAGNGTPFYNQGDGVPATSTGISNVTGITVDAAGNLYIATYQGFLVLKVTPGGIISTLAGNGNDSDSGDGGPATQAGVAGPQSIAVDSSGNVYFTEAFNAVVREVMTNGTITTIAGNGTTGYSGDGGPALSAEIGTADGIAFGGGKLYLADVLNERIRVLSGGQTTSAPPPSVSSGGIVSLSQFGDLLAAAPGSWIEIYGSNLAVDSRTWGSGDFNGENAPTSLDGTSVSIGGQAAFVYYISGTQVDVQVPSNVPTGSQPLIVKTPSGSSAPVNVTINATEPGLLAPSSFDIGGKQYVVALFPDNTTYVLPTGAIAGLTSRPAQPGDIITMYGVGFGPVTPSIPAGQIVQADNSLASTVQFSFAGTPVATPTYAGLAPTFVGLYQFDVVVPSVSPSASVPLTFSIGGVQGSQTLYIAVGN